MLHLFTGACPFLGYLQRFHAYNTTAVPNLFQPCTPYRHTVDPLPLTVLHLVDPLQPYVSPRGSMDPRLGTTAIPA